MPITPLSLFKSKATRAENTPPQTAEQFPGMLKPGVTGDLIDGRVCMHAPSSTRQAALATFLFELMNGCVEQMNLPGVLHRQPFLVKLGGRDMFMPDLCYFAQANAVRLGLTHTSIAPALVAEVTSADPLSAFSAKFAAYEQHDVQECWLLDADQGRHHFYRRAGKRLEEFAARGEKIVSAALPGFWVRRVWLDPDKLPKVAACLKEIMRGVRNPSK
jgi:Uma2 family endonuclease